ncbi:MAG: NADH-quinone oxidoreductase subunit H [Methanomicrobiales archaeon]|nr:NADH-quinone oxidoreductase subunit H [Methanomicrobiales archaeon]
MDPLLLVLYILLFPGILFLLVYALFLEYVDRKILARMQNRVGPPLLQPLADLVKMLGKEVIDPRGVDRGAFDAAPLLAFASVVTAFLYIPVVGTSPLSFEGDLVLVLYLLTIPTVILFLMGWLSRNVYSTVGGVRAVTQLFIYEVPFFLALLLPAMMAGSWNISTIVQWQQGHLWFAVLQPIGFVIAIIGLQAKLERTPFDIPEAETEIVAGPWTELTGRRLAVLHLAMDISLVVGSGLVAALFLGGPLLPWDLGNAWLNGVAGFLLFLVKTLAILLVLVTFKAATGRIRIDQLNDIGWKYIAGAALIQAAGVLILSAWWVST